jgi:hypothetical protein
MRQRIGRLLSALAIVALVGATPTDPSQSSDPLGKLGMWVGQWAFSGQIYGTKYSAAHSDSGTADCNWTPNEGYVICEYFSTDPPHDDLGIFSYSPSTKAYTHVNIHKDALPVFGKVTQSGYTWIVSSNIRYNGNALVLRTVFVFLSPDKQTTTVQASADEGKSWTTMIQVTAVKVAKTALGGRP